MKRVLSVFALIPLFLLFALAPGVAFADAPGANPVILSTAYPSVIADQGSALTFSIDL